METTRVIDFHSEESHLLLNPRMPESDRSRLEALYAAAPRIAAHVWLSTSGSTGGLKLVALSKAAMLASAAAVNRRLNVRGGEVWCSVLPSFHVGGLGIWARAAISEGRVIQVEWEASRFAEVCSREQVSISSLVPAQVVDLVRAQIRAPESMRAIVVGGGALSDDIYESARALGWPVLPSYGMTECASQIATALPGEPDLYLLDHLRARQESDGRLAFAGSSLLSGYAMFVDERPVFVDPKSDGWFVSEDLGRVDGSRVVIEGRAGEVVKIGGELVSLSRLDRILEEIVQRLAVRDAALVAIPDERLGAVVHVAVVGERGEIQGIFNDRVAPFERIRRVHFVEAIPRSPLGKLLRSQLAQVLSKNRE